MRGRGKHTALDIVSFNNNSMFAWKKHIIHNSFIAILNF